MDTLAVLDSRRTARIGLDRIAAVRREDRDVGVQERRALDEPLAAGRQSMRVREPDATLDVVLAELAQERRPVGLARADHQRQEGLLVPEQFVEGGSRPRGHLTRRRVELTGLVRLDGGNPGLEPVEWTCRERTVVDENV